MSHKTTVLIPVLALIISITVGLYVEQVAQGAGAGVKKPSKTLTPTGTPMMKIGKISSDKPTSDKPRANPPGGNMTNSTEGGNACMSCGGAIGTNMTNATMGRNATTDNLSNPLLDKKGG